MSEFKEEPQRWSIVIDGMRHALSLEQIFNLRNACDAVLEQRSRDTEDIIGLVCLKLNMERHEIFSPNRTERSTMARFCAWHMMKEQGISVSEIGKQFKKTHSNVTRGIHRLQHRIKNNPDLQKKLSWLGEKLRKSIKSRHGNKV